jgi:hypothetical protein
MTKETWMSADEEKYLMMFSQLLPLPDTKIAMLVMSLLWNME